MAEGIVYLIHFERPLHHAQHYLGFCEDGNLIDRFHRHQSGHGSRLLRAVSEAGINFEIVRTWTGTRTFERSLKKRRNARKLCPVCIKEVGDARPKPR